MQQRQFMGIIFFTIIVLDDDDYEGQTTLIPSAGK